MSSEQLRSERHGPTLVVHLGPAYNSLDENLLGEVQQYLLSCAETEGIRNLVVDLSDTKFFGSSMIEVLFRAYNRIKRKGGRFVLSGLQPYPAEVVAVSRLDSIWQLFPSAMDAVRALAAA